jgi:hypothetical protein
MVDALTLSDKAGSKNAVILHQLLHGYADGHRLLGSSTQLPDDLTRLVLRMSDLSGSNVALGFEEYITGYPLPSLSAYAMAKTWYASEMPRPGCVWTHTIIIPEEAFVEIPDLSVVLSLFSRPTENSKELYNKCIHLDSNATSQAYQNDRPQSFSELERLLRCLYENSPDSILIPCGRSKEYEAMLLAVWSQQWLDLRIAFTFCTGSLSARSYAGHPFVVQCVPKALIHEVVSEVASLKRRHILFDAISLDAPAWTKLAVEDVLKPLGGELRKFLWSITDSSCDRSKYIPLLEIYAAITNALSIVQLVDLVARTFPEPNTGVRLKTSVFGLPQHRLYVSKDAEEDVLLALGMVGNFSAFDADAL